jgi:molybdenum cofactor cytidylyltransferase
MKFALLPAAGKSTRMGRPKLTLPLGDRTILEHVIAALHEADVRHILVVIAPQDEELATLALKAGAYVHRLSEETADMRATIEQGLRWVQGLGPEDLWLLVPADHPTLSSAVVRKLEQAAQSHPQHSIIVPTFQGRRGHPLALAWKHVDDIRALPPDCGLNTYVRNHAEETLEVPVTTETILWDLDTPEDYERLKSHRLGQMP